MPTIMRPTETYMRPLQFFINYSISPLGCPILNFFLEYLADFCDFTMIFILIFARGEAGRFASVVDPTETPYMSM